MNIYVDADACPVVSIVEEISKKYNIPLPCFVIPIMYCIRSTVRWSWLARVQMRWTIS